MTAAPQIPRPAASEVRLRVVGIPATQGDHMPGKTKEGKLYLRPKFSAEQAAWRRQVTASANAQLPRDRVPLDGPLYLEVIFAFLRKPTQVARGDLVPTGPPDYDKLARAISDALKLARVIHDDSRIVEANVRKRFAGIGRGVPSHPGALIYVRPLLPDEV